MHPDYKDIGDPFDKTIEELAELSIELNSVIKAICKGKRFGWLNKNPVTEITNVDNVINLIKNISSETGDVLDRCNELTCSLELLKLVQDFKNVTNRIV